MSKIKIPGIGIVDVTDPRAIAYKQQKEAQDEASKTPLQKRRDEYGTVQEQLEFIVENGIEVFIAKQQAIKAKYPKE